MIVTDLLERVRRALPPHYRVERPLGTGGQGAVFLGTLKGRQVALKLFTADTDLKRVEREIQTLMGVKCSNLVKLYNVELITVDGVSVPLAAYEYISGRDLRAAVDDQASQLDCMSLVQIGSQIAGAVEALWAKRIVHRDIKPENIIAAADGRYVLVDVGFALHLDLSTISAYGVPGTRGYKSPEQAKGRRKLTIHSDIFSLGVTIYELAAKQHPWGRNQQIMGRLSAPPLASVRPDLSPRLIRLVHQMLAVRPAERPIDIQARFNALVED